MIHADFENLLRQVMGLDAASIGSYAIERAVMERSSVCEINDSARYFEMLCASATEQQALIEAVIVPETWFFRDPQAFHELSRIATQEWLPANRKGILRLLSVPCSSGEEPYSMAMALLDAGFPQSRCRIDAVDISAHGLKAARGTLYGKNSFRGADLTFRDRHFDRTVAGFRLKEAVLRQVHFQHGNLLGHDFMEDAAPYDVIFCRNLLIYFDPFSQDRAVEVFNRLLKPNGVLFVGPSECGVLLNHGFESCRVPLAFAHQRVGSAASILAPARTLLEPPPRVHPVLPIRPQTDSAMPAPAARSPAHDAFLLADQGRMMEAAEVCEDQLRKHGPSVQSYFLLGLIRAADDNLNDAREYYRKALYLDRHHEGTLLHLMLLLEKQGDATGAKVIRERLQRLELKRIA